MNKRFSKFMLTSASALALLAAYPSVASTAEVVGLDLPAITAEAATQGNAFVRVVRALPSVANITSADAASVRAARNLYNSLPNAEKASADVTRWVGYLADKEAALPVDHVRNFLLESRVLPNVAEINAMNAKEFAQAKVDLQAARASYAQLTKAEKANAEVARWAGYLTVKEDAFGVTFILAAKDLPSMDAIGKMDAKELVVVQEDIDSVRELYDALSDVAKADKEVARWIGYVDQKEEAVEAAAVLKIESVSAINAKALKVSFNKPVEETDKAKFAVKRDTFKVNVASVKWNEENTEATLNLTSKILKGEYSVEVTGLADEALTGSVKTEAEKVDAINILTEEAPKVSTKDGNGKVTEEKIVVKYEVLNQYGEDITKLNTITATAAGKNVISDADENQTKGTITVTAKPDFDKDASVNLTIVHGNSGTVINKAVKVVAEAKIDNVVIGELYNKDGKTLSEDTVISKDKFYLPIEVKDQYGNAVTKADDVTAELIVTNTNDAVLKVNKTVKQIKIDDKDVLALEITEVGIKGSTDVLAIVTSTGKQDRVKLEVAEGVKTDEVVLGQPEGLVTAEKAAKFPLTVYNNKGEEVTDLAKVKAGLTVTGPTGIDIQKAKDGKLYVVVPNGQVKENTAITVTVMSQTNKVVTQTVLPRAKAVAQIIVGLTDNTKTSFREAGDITLTKANFIFEDQYGQEMKASETDVTVKAKLGVEANKSPLALSGTNNLRIAKNAGYTGDKVSDKVTFEIAGKDGSAFEQEFTIVKDNALDSYAVKDLPTVVVEAIPDGDNKGKYQVFGTPTPTVEVVGKSGTNEVALKTDEYKVLSFDGVSELQKTGTDSQALTTNQLIKGLTFPKDAKEVTKTLTFVINATGETIKKDVTFSTEKAKTDKLVVLDADNKAKFDANQDYTELTKATFEGSKTAHAPLDANAIKNLVKVAGFDQYGNRIYTSTISTDSIRIVGDRKEVKIDGNLTGTASVVEAKAGAKVTVYLREGSVESKGVEITLTNGVTTQADFDAAAKAAANVLIDSAVVRLGTALTVNGEGELADTDTDFKTEIESKLNAKLAEEPAITGITVVATKVADDNAAGTKYTVTVQDSATLGTLQTINLVVSK